MTRSVRPGRPRRAWLRRALWLPVGLLLSSLALADIVGPEGPSDPLLESLEVRLRPDKVDVVLGNTSEAAPSAKRARLAKLDGFVVEEAALRTPGAWEADFKQGLDAVIGVKPPTPPLPGGAEIVNEAVFEAHWNRAPKHRRVFVAFARADAQSAEAVRKALIAEGYEVFTYLRGNASGPWARSEFVGRMFAGAGKHYVIDSPFARVSKGTLFESLTLRESRGRPGGVGAGPEPGKPSGRSPGFDPNDLLDDLKCKP